MEIELAQTDKNYPPQSRASENYKPLAEKTQILWFLYITSVVSLTGLADVKTWNTGEPDWLTR